MELGRSAGGRYGNWQRQPKIRLSCWLPLRAMKPESPFTSVGMCFRILHPRFRRWDHLSTGSPNPVIKDFLLHFKKIIYSCLLQWAFSRCREQGLLWLWCVGFSLGASLLVEHRLRASAVVEHGPSCPLACGILLYQGSNLCPPALACTFPTTGPPESFFTFFSCTAWHVES